MATGTISKYADGNDSGWLTFVGGQDKEFSGTIYYRTIGPIVFLVTYHLTLNTALTSTGGRNIIEGGLASIAPNSTVTFPAGNSNAFGQIAINTSGNIRFYRAGSVSSWNTTDNINFTGMYLMA